MSVIAYTKDEVLAMFAATWNRGSIGSSDAHRYMEHLAEQGNAILRANCAAYAKTYNEPSEVGELPITGRDIESALIRNTVDTKLRGMRTLRGLRYNLIANDGTDFATIDILDVLLQLTSAAFEQATGRAA